MQLQRSSVSLVALVLLAVACSERPDRISGPAGGETSTKASPEANVASESAILTGFEVVYDGRTYDAGGDQTTFSYTVRSSGAAHALSNFVLQLPDCAPALAGSSPAGGSVGTDPHTGLDSIKWNLSIEPDDTVGRSYSVTYPGDIVEGIVRVAVKASTDFERGILPGACGGYDISGVVFVDRDADGSRDVANEPGVFANVTVALVNPDGNVETQKTNALGQYLFRRADGEYIIRIDAATADADFNEELAESFAATTPLSATVTVGPDSPANNFGFDPQTQKITEEINTGVLPTNGQNAKFWTNEIRTAKKGSGNATYAASTVYDFLCAVEGLFFADPYQFDDAAKFDAALAILTGNTRTELEYLIRELLVTELNHVAGLGLINDLDFQAVLISWGESWVRERQGLSSGLASVRKPRSDDAELQDVSQMFNAIND